jgi:hypothetical protein
MGDALALDHARSTKTYVIESHADDPVGCLSELASGNVEQMADAYLFRVRTTSGAFWVDQLDERFWRFHTDMGQADAYPMLRDWVGSRRDFDWMWLPTEHLSRMWPGATARRVRNDFRSGRLGGPETAAQDLRAQLHGSNAEEFFEAISKLPQYRSAVSFEAVETEISDAAFGGSVREAVNRMGRFAAAGDSLELHLQFVSTVVDRYRRLVELCESKAVNWHGSPDATGGGTVAGGPIVIEFRRDIDDVGAFADELTSSREPFRLWGIANVRRNVAEVEAVDLHVGRALQLDIGRRWMRVYLRDGSCGNTVARLISNLQHRFDGALTLKDPDLAAATSRPTAVRA